MRSDWHATVDRIVHRLELTGCSQTDALDAELPGLSDTDRVLWAGRVRQAVFRGRRAGRTLVAQPEHGKPVEVAAPARPSVRYGINRADEDHSAVDLERIPYLRRQLSQVERAMDRAIEDAQWRLYPQLDKRRSEVAAELETEMERVRQVVSLEPRPGALMEWLDGQRELVARGADLERRRLARRAEAREGEGGE